MKYQTTKKQCQDKINELNNVCDRCGRKLAPIRTVDNSGSPTYWVGCLHGTDAGNFTWGVKEETYKLAYKLVLEDSLYLSMDKEPNSDFDYLFENGVSKIARMIQSIEYMKNHKPRKTKTELRKEYNKFYKK